MNIVEAILLLLGSFTLFSAFIVTIYGKEAVLTDKYAKKVKNK